MIAATTRRRLVAGLLVPALWLALLAGIGAAGWRSHTQLVASAAQVQGTQRALTLLAGLMVAMTDAEAVQRGDSLSADASFVEPLQRARTDVDASLAGLRTLLASQPETYSRLIALGPLLTQRFDALAAAVEQRRRGSTPAQTLAASVEGRRLHDKVRVAVAELRQRVEADLVQLQRRSEDTAARALNVVWLGTGAALLLGAYALWRLRRDLRALRTSEAAREAGAQREAALAAELQRVFDLAPDAVCLLDAEGRFARAGAGCERLWGWRADELAGRTWLDLVLPDDRARSRATAARVLAGAPRLELRNRCQRKDGVALPVLWSLGGSDDGASLFCVARDLTETEALRDAGAQQASALRDGAAELAQASARAAAADRLKAAFLSNMSHELRTPLNAIIGGTDVLRQGLAGAVTTEQQKQLDAMLASARHLLVIVNDVLDVARIEAGEVTLPSAPFDLWETTRKVAAALRAQAERKGLVLEVELDRDLPLARGDARRVEQMLRNLLDNAIKFTARGHVTVGARAQPDARLRVTVADTGIGIAEADLPQLFKPFRPLDTRAVRQHEGAGLGLALSQRLARLMGGDIEVQSTPGQGSTFTLWLPAA
jgi:PAS domain S-box-containing protein